MANITQIKLNGTTYDVKDAGSAKAIDSSNLIASVVSSNPATYTLTQDCWITFCGYETRGDTIKVGTVTLFALDNTTSNGRHGYGPFYVKKGSKVQIQVNNTGVSYGIKAFGCK